MLRLLFFSLNLMFSCICLSAQILIKNAGFEEIDSQSALFVQDWDKEFDYELGGIDSIEVWEGKYSMHLKKLANGTGRFYQSIRMDSDRLRKYRISGAIKTKNIGDHHAAIFARATDSAGFLICYQNMRHLSSRLSGSSDWQVYQAEFYITKDVSELKVGGFLWGAGEAWFDAIKVEEIALQEGVLKPQIEEYLEEYFDLISTKSLVRDTSLIQTLRSNARALCNGMTELEDVHFILKNITFNLKDGHSFFSSPQEWKDLHQSSENLKKSDIQFSNGKILEGNIAYIHVPTFSSLDPFLVRKSVDSLQGLIQRLDNVNLKGWVIDLSQNSGGNSFAMIPGLGPLLGDGPCGQSISADGTCKTLFYKQGLIGWDDDLDTLVVSPYYVKKDSLPIAIIYSSRTASSGEAVALAFRGKENCRSFGQETAGLTTRVDNFVLSDSASLNLATAYKADRNGILFKGTKIPPDLYTEKYDESLSMSIKWILTCKD